MEIATYFQGKGEEPHWQRERSRKTWCKVMRTREHAEDPRSVLELRENKSSIEGLLGKATAATESRTVEFSWNGNRCERQVRQRWRKERQVQRWRSTWLESGSPVASSVASSAPQTETSTTVGTIDTIECTALDLCATTMAQQEVVNSRWTAFNGDTGAGGTVWPVNADYA